MLIAENVHKSYGNLQVLKGINLTVKEGEVVSLVGASGAGKSTLLHILGTLDTMDRGKIWIGGEDISMLKESALAVFRNRKIGFVFQFHHLLPEFTALENVEIPAMIGKKPAKQTRNKAEKLLSLLGLDARAGHKPSELSGGEQQRVAVARALINDPVIVFADEPSGNLDSDNSRELHNLFFKLRDDLGQTFVVATHNLELADMADRKLTIKDGIVI